MNILVINTGSSSLKYKLFDMAASGSRTGMALAGGVIERIGESKAGIRHTVFNREPEDTIQEDAAIRNHEEAFLKAVDLMTDNTMGVIGAIKDIDAIGHRVVQGGEIFKSAILIDERVKSAIRDNNNLAPLHNPANLTGIEVSQRIFREKPNIAVFDTNFHQTLEPRAYLYGLPHEFYTRYKIRKYGFHGTSHKYVARRAAELMGKKPDQVNLITLHLGNGCSACAVENGVCKDTSMGLTPLAGLMMGTRSGDFDPAVITYLLAHADLDIIALDRILNKESGLKGICGLNDMRDIHDRVQKGDDRARLALDMFAYRIKKQIGEYAAALGMVDAVVFTGGIGENDPIVRTMACSDLFCLGLQLDPEKNRNAASEAFSIHGADSRVAVWVVPTDEERQIAKEAFAVLENKGRIS